MRRANGLEEFYSRNFNDDDFEYFIDKYGQPTIDYPHVHIWHRQGNVFVIASQTREKHIWRIRLIDPDGNEVNRAIKFAINQLY